MGNLIFILFILPLFIGIAVDVMYKGEMGLPLCFVVGFLVIMVDYAIPAYPAIILGYSFHSTVYLALVIFAGQFLASVALFVRQRSELKIYFLSIVENIKGKNNIIFYRIYEFWLMIGICGFQIIRQLILQPAEYRDSKTYVSLVNDILSTDLLYNNDWFTGEILASRFMTSAKFFFSTWYPFMAMLSKVCRLHPAEVMNRILPPYIIFMSFIVLWQLGRLLFNDNIKYCCLFLFFCGVLLELTIQTDISIIYLVWPMWGKGVLSNIVVPLILILFMSNPTENKKILKSSIAMLILSIAGCTLSTMSVMIVSMEIVLLTCILFIKEKNYRYIFLLVSGIFPQCIYALFFLYYNGWI